jgi:leukotriene-A4 hydrolase
VRDDHRGMENPCLTFVTPALITGDRESVDVIAHEICHSWFGNGIGCASWSHFWLNEGWTTYSERLSSTNTEAERGFEYIIGAKALYDSLSKMPPKYQRLVIDYKEGEDPDDGFSSIPYEKGATLLLHLERTVGGLEIWKPYIKAYVDKFMGRSITTDDWLSHFWNYWNACPEAAKKLRAVKWDQWLHGEGMELPEKIEFDTSSSFVSCLVSHYSVLMNDFI